MRYNTNHSEYIYPGWSLQYDNWLSRSSQWVNVGTDFPMKSAVVINPFHPSSYLIRHTYLPIILKPCFMAAVQTCTEVAPATWIQPHLSRYWYRQYLKWEPCWLPGSLRYSPTSLRAIGFTAAGPSNHRTPHSYRLHKDSEQKYQVDPGYRLYRIDQRQCIGSRFSNSLSGRYYWMYIRR